jgi:hypothetical protein
MGRRIGRPEAVEELASPPRLVFSTPLALTFALAVLATLGRDVPCSAQGLVIEAPNITATAGSTGSFDLLLVNTNPSGGGSFDVAADSLQLSLTGPLTVTFTDVSINTIVPYIYVTSGTTQGGGPLSLDTFPNTQFTASDSEFAAPGFRTINPGDVFGLGHVSFAVDSSTPNGVDSIVISSGAATSLSDENGNAIPFSIQNGSIQVGPSIIPEPAALTQGTTAALVGLGAFWWQRRRRRARAG